MLNPFRRSIRLPGKLGACLITGTEKIRCGYGNGDCLLLDFRHGVFAVADATERFPQASRHLLERLAAELDRSGAPTSASQFDRLLARIWSRQPFIHKTTLSCVVLPPNGRTGPALVANDGDSTVTVVSAGSNEILYRTGVDMNFAGRSRIPNRVETLGLEDPKAAILLTTDGISSALLGSYAGIADHPDEVPDRIAGGIERHGDGAEIDDIGMIALSCQRLNGSSSETIVIGGTTPGLETAFVNGGGENTSMDRWAPIERWKTDPALLAKAGISIR